MIEPEYPAGATWLEGLVDDYNLLGAYLDDIANVLEDLLEALDEVDRQPTEVRRRHLTAVRLQARRVLRDDPTALTAASSEGDTFLGHLVLDYLATCENPEVYFGPDAPNPRRTMAAAVRWSVSEGRLSLEQAEAIQRHLDQDTAGEDR